MTYLVLTFFVILKTILCKLKKIEKFNLFIEITSSSDTLIIFFYRVDEH